MIDREHKLSITRQAKLLDISRGTVYYLPQPVSPADLALMRQIDELHLEHPFMGSRMLATNWPGKASTPVGVTSERCHFEQLRQKCQVSEFFCLR
jgi:putative transposase